MFDAHAQKKYSNSNAMLQIFDNLFHYKNIVTVQWIKRLKDIYFVIYGIISDFTDKGQFQYLTNLKGPQEGTYLYTTQFLSLR